MKFNDWLLLLFVYLKLTNQVNWSWWQVLIPFWVWLAVHLGVEVKKVIKRGETSGVHNTKVRKDQND